ncbi:hypothetical protein Aduo_018763 [Ancylostoma duodenale]
MSLPTNGGNLVGKPTVVRARLMGKEIPALLDTGSVISVILVRILEDAQKRAYDLDRLKVLKMKSNKVYDASNNAMTFVGAVRINIEIEGQKRAVAFRILRDEQNELLLGTNALEDSGVKVVISGEEQETPKGLLDQPWRSEHSPPRCRAKVDIRRKASGNVLTAAEDVGSAEGRDVRGSQ